MAQPAPAAAAAPAARAAPRAAAAPALARPVVLPDEFAGTSGDDWVTYLARFNVSCVACALRRVCHALLHAHE